MNAPAIDAAPAPRLDTLVTDPVTGVERRRTDYAGTVWYGGRPQVMGRMTVTVGSGAQISTPFWLPDSHLYAADAVADAQVQAGAALQSGSDPIQILDVGAGLGEDPQGGGLRVFVAVSAMARVPLGVSYRVTVVCDPGAISG